MRFQKFDQSYYLGKDDRGICIHLAIMWLSDGGKKLAHLFGGRVRQAKKIYASGAKINDALLNQYFLGIQDADIFELMGQIDEAADFLEKPGLYIVGFANSDGDGEGGHAIGFIKKQGGGSAAFDPNEGYSWFDSEKEYSESVYKALLDYNIDQNYNQALIYRCGSTKGQGMARLKEAGDIAAKRRRRGFAFRPNGS